MASINNFKVKRNNKKNTVGVLDKQKNFNKTTDNITKSERLMEGVNIWGAFYRMRPDIFVKDYLGIELKPFQQVVLYCMMHYNYSMVLASRGKYLASLYRNIY